MATTNYVGIVGESLNTNDGLFPSRYGNGDRKVLMRFSNVLDGLSNTLALCERPMSNFTVVGAWQASQECGSQTIGVREGVSYWTATYPSLESCTNVRFSNGDPKRICDQIKPWSYHFKGANFLIADGSTQEISYSINEKVIIALSTIAGNEPVGE